MSDEREELIEIEEEPRRWTFLNYVKSINKFKWWIIGFSVFGAVAGYLGFRLVLNPSKKTLNATYTYELAGKYEDTDTIRLIDGSTFNPYDLTGEKYLTQVKESKADDYIKINIKKIVTSSGIAITKNVTYYNESDINNSSISYTIKAKASLFPSDKVGQAFIYDLISLPKTLSTKAIENYDTMSYFTDNFESLNFDRQISQIDNQYEAILNTYNELTRTFNGSVVANEEGVKLYELQNKYTSQYITGGIQKFTKELSGIAEANKYVNYTDAASKITEIESLCKNYIESLSINKTKIATLQDQLNTLVNGPAVIASDTNVSSQIAALNSQITELKLANDDLERELKNNGYFYDNTEKTYIYNAAYEDSVLYKLNQVKNGAPDTDWVKGNEAFKARILEYKEDKLDTDRQTVSKAYQYCYSQYRNRVNILDGGYVTLNGAISNIIGAGAGLVAGFVITSLITAAIYIYRKEEDR